MQPHGIELNLSVSCRSKAEPTESQPLKPKLPSPPASPTLTPPAPPSSPTPLLEGCPRESAMRRLVRAVDLDLQWNLRYMNLAVGTGLVRARVTLTSDL